MTGAPLMRERPPGLADRLHRGAGGPALRGAVRVATPDGQRRFVRVGPDRGTVTCGTSFSNVHRFLRAPHRHLPARGRRAAPGAPPGRPCGDGARRSAMTVTAGLARDGTLALALARDRAAAGLPGGLVDRVGDGRRLSRVRGIVRQTDSRQCPATVGPGFTVATGISILGFRYRNPFMSHDFSLADLHSERSDRSSAGAVPRNALLPVMSGARHDFPGTLE